MKYNFNTYVLTPYRSIEHNKYSPLLSPQNKTNAKCWRIAMSLISEEKKESDLQTTIRSEQERFCKCGQM